MSSPVFAAPARRRIEGGKAREPPNGLQFYAVSLDPVRLSAPAPHGRVTELFWGVRRGRLEWAGGKGEGERASLLEIALARRIVFDPGAGFHPGGDARTHSG
jgi:hypothetical protein